MDSSSPVSNPPSQLSQPVTLGALRLRNRVVMSPMTRLRADADLRATPLMAAYYAQRASAGLIISETLAVAPYGDGYPNIPGLFTAEQVASWRPITDAIHAAGGHVVAQLWHVGRPRYEQAHTPRPPGWALAEPLAPHDLSAADLRAMRSDFAHGARAAKEAGFDGVEIHSGNGYLLDQFLRGAANLRTDAHGGPLTGRARLLTELLDAAAGVFGADRVGVRLSPSATVGGAPDPESFETFSQLFARLGGLGLAYVHATRTTEDDRARGAGPGIALPRLRPHYPGRLIGAGDFTREDGEQALGEGWLDAVAYGRLFIANPDLPERFFARAALNTPRRETFYTPGADGLTDYPRLAAAT